MELDAAASAQSTQALGNDIAQHVITDNSSSNSFFKSDNCRGSALVSSAASSTRFTSCTSNDSESMGRFHINRRIRLLLRHFDQSLARELENRKECHNELRHAVSRTE